MCFSVAEYLKERESNLDAWLRLSVKFKRKRCPFQINCNICNAIFSCSNFHVSSCPCRIVGVPLCVKKVKEILKIIKKGGDLNEILNIEEVEERCFGEFA